MIISMKLHQYYDYDNWKNRWVAGRRNSNSLNDTSVNIPPGEYFPVDLNLPKDRYAVFAYGEQAKTLALGAMAVSGPFTSNSANNVDLSKGDF